MDQHSTSAYDHLLKILLIGDVESGKRELMRKYIGDEDMSDTTTLGEQTMDTNLAVCRIEESNHEQQSVMVQL